MWYSEGVNNEIEGENCVKYAILSFDKARRIKKNNRYKIKINTSWTNEFYTSSGKIDRQVTNGYKEHMYVEVNCKSGDDQVYRLTKSYRLAKT